ncbi:MAG: FtsW/RodA/SpoVE family cell cycle protein, partial [Micromonosporaceae bacterium]|nr:FtsW/RodA/SpoVE family cell cycle protein [Micromonosporaceae bacterium]
MISVLRGVLQRPLASYYLLISSAGLLLVIGLTMVFSATSVQAFESTGNAFAPIAKQTVFAVIGLVAFWVFQRLPVRTLRALALPMLVVSLALLTVLDMLLLVQSVTDPEAVGPATLGPLKVDLNWLYLGPVQVQPSELAKLALVAWGADVLARKGAALGWWRELATPLFPAVALLFLLVGYNDLGTMLCLLVLVVGLLWAAGIRLWFFALMGAAGLGGVLLLIVAKASYRVERLTAFLD